MTARNDHARAATAALLATGQTLGPRALAAALGISPSTAHAILASFNTSTPTTNPNPGTLTMPNAPATLDAAASVVLPSTILRTDEADAGTRATAIAAGCIATVDDAAAAADAQLAAAMAAVAAAQMAKAKAEAEAKAKAAAAEAARIAAEQEQQRTLAEAHAKQQAEQAAMAKAKAKATAKAEQAPVPALAAVAAAQAKPQAGPADLPPIVSRWQFEVPQSMGKNWIGRRQELALLSAWIAQPDGPCGLTGPKGSGKTALLREAAARAGRVFLRVNGHRDMVSSDLVGSWVTRADRTLAWSDGPLPAAMRAGACLLVDEWDRIPSGTTSVAQAVMEGDSLTIPETGESVSPAPGFCIVASANSIGDRSGGYAATLPVDAATLDRFGLLLRIDPMGKADLRRLIRSHVPACSDAHRESALAYHLALCEAAEKGDLSEIPSPRRLLALCRWVSRGVDPALAVAATYADRLDATEGEAVRALASRMVTPDAALLQAALAEAQAELAAGGVA